MEEVKCTECGNVFASQEALEMHSKAKHPREEDKPSFFSVHKKRIRNWSIAAVIVIAIIAGIYGLSTTALDCETAPVTEMNIGGHSKIMMHDHTQLDITILGNKEFIPPEIGQGTNFMRGLHTHEADGNIHVEAPCVREFTLGEFFAVWNKTFNKDCIFDYCADGNHTVKMLVNGKPNTEYENIILRNGDKIEIIYE
ncbi:MAG TPA: C2H2-type zinc finger protein [Candidatus Nanoarchaeia archaeon]|nr:C2H2-type zinc finger protein [Candidatus Nanoarchaeia archaeon]